MSHHAPSQTETNTANYKPNQVIESEYVADTTLGELPILAVQQSTRVSNPADFHLTDRTFGKETIDWSRVADHICIHHGGEVAGSQFNSELFNNPDDVIKFAESVLPPVIRYDQADRAELTLAVDLPEGTSIGFTGVKSLDELQTVEGAVIERRMRIPDGEPDVVEGVTGAWFPERVKNPETGAFEVARTDDGNVKNPYGQFVPESLIATIPTANGLRTNNMTIIVQRDPQQDKPSVLTVFPGDNAPASPVLIDSEQYKQNTLHDEGPNAFWQSHAFVSVHPQ